MDEKIVTVVKLYNSQTWIQTTRKCQLKFLPPENGRLLDIFKICSWDENLQNVQYLLKSITITVQEGKYAILFPSAVFLLMF